ncbi:MAG: pyruvate dehydrogenase (acetyl-transferring) E1 component subunit alpha [Methanomassiliicoccales archaeon]|nr:MAG: pyruvate dehydrogenase (acetyl-transferring) E1 component subunit alpha [Methanomassiliicoccales archaeon]
MLRILDVDGNVNRELEPEIDDSTLLRMYRNMSLTRIADDKAVKLQRQGRLGAYPPSKGQEASQTGPAAAMDKEDWTVWAFRELGNLLYRGIPLSTLYLYWMGNEEGSKFPDGMRITPSAVPVGSQVPHAVGIAYAAKVRKERSAVVCYFGDGATSEGEFHEGMNFAGVLRTPNVFICQNNQWAISVPRTRQTASRTIAQKALAYGFPGILVDGNDALAMFAATKEALDRARNGEGPTLIESYTYRMGDHTTSDDATRYRLEKEIAEWALKDPLKRFRRYIEERGIWNEVKEREMQDGIASFVEAEVKKAEGHPRPTLEDVFRYTYAEMTDDLKEQMEALSKAAHGRSEE